jgi:hypothetical protein
VSAADGRGGESAHRGGQPSRDTSWVADLIGVLTQGEPGGLNRVFLFFPGEPILVADTAHQAGVLVGELGDIQASTWHVGGGLLGAHFAGPFVYAG